MTDFYLQTSQWYRRNHRSLPWRETKNPYFIWLSEIILQQTRVDQGTSYYLRFIETFPTITDLANAEEQQVLRLWQGLGYYSRARNLHASAKIIRDTFDGKFPTTYLEILALKGVGSYTASAIASFAFDLPYAVLDGNVFRVLSRVFGIETPINSSAGQKEFQQLADELLSIKNPAIHNQAIMEFGALQCTPTKPNCTICPLNSQCIAFEKNLVNSLPRKQGKTKVKDRFVHYLFLKDSNFFFLKQRTKKDIWQHMFEFPMIETETKNSPELLVTQELIFETKHILSHQRILAKFYAVSNEHFDFSECEKIPLIQLDNFPIHRLMQRFMEEVYVHL